MPLGEQLSSLNQGLDKEIFHKMMETESTLINGIKNSLIFDFKHKANIPIEKSATLIGVIDYTGTLESD